MILAGFSYDPKICNFKFQNEFKMKLFRGFQGIIPLQFSFINPRMSPNTLKLAFTRCFILGNGLREGFKKKSWNFPIGAEGVRK